MKDQYKFFKDQINLNNNNNGKDDIRKEDDGKILDVDQSYIYDEYKDVIDNILKFRLRDGDLHLTEYDN